MIAVLLRFMDSFMIYTEPFVLTGGGPGNATTFLSQYLTQKAVGQFDLGPAAAFSLIYFLIILLLCFILCSSFFKLREFQFCCFNSWICKHICVFIAFFFVFDWLKPFWNTFLFFDFYHSNNFWPQVPPFQCPHS